MLSTEYSIQINGITLFRDHADKRKYYYLPKGDIHIADNGRKLNYFAYVDSSMADSLEQQGGFLTFEVELGPNDEELEKLKTHFPELLKYAKNQAIAEKRAKGEPITESDWDKEMDAEENNLSASDFVLVPVPFKDGDVKLCVLGEDGSVENPLSQVKIVGSQKPSLYGKQTAVFSVRLTGKDADIMYQMLNISKKDKDGDASAEKDDKYINSHIAVVYDLTYKGIAPAHYVKITIDFHAVEDYWNHHVNANVNFNYAGKESPKAGKETDTSKFSIPVVLSADLDFMYRDLINDGAIVVQQIDYTGNDVGSPLEGDPSAIKLVKELMSAELFEATAAPSAPQEKSSVVSDVAKAVGSASEAVGKVASTVAEIKANEKKTDDKNAVAGKADDQVTDKVESPSYPAFKDISNKKQKISWADWVKIDKLPKDAKSKAFFDKYAVVDVNIGYEDWKKVRNDEKEWKQNSFIGEEEYDKYRRVVKDQNNKNDNKNDSKNDSKNDGDGKLDLTGFKDIARKDGKISREEWEEFWKGKEDSENHGFDKYAAIGIKLKHAEWIEKLNEGEEFWESYSFIGEKEYEELLKAETGGKSKDSGEKKSTKTEGVPSTVSAVEWSLGVNVGYTLKRRKTDEKVKRTYVFNKQSAVDYIIHPSGMLTVDGTDFDVDKQVTVGRLGEGPFRNHEIYFGSALDFDTYHLEKILIEVKHMDSAGTVIELTKEKTNDTIHFTSERFNIAADNEEKLDEEAKQNAYAAGDKLSYRVSFIFKPLTIMGYDNEDRVLIKTAEKYTSSKVIMIGPEDIERIYALDIQTGSLTLGKNVKSATLSLLEAGNVDRSIYSQKLTSDTDKIVLLNPEKKYMARVQYNLESTFDNIAVTKKEFTYTTDVLTAKELVIQDPTAGMVKITTADGEDTFESVSSIEVTLKTEDGREKDIILRKKKPEYYFVTDYTAGEPKVVTVESVIVNYDDDSSEELKISERRKKFYTDETEYVLNI